MSSTTSSGLRVSDSVVKPRMSENSSVTSRRAVSMPPWSSSSVDDVRVDEAREHRHRLLPLAALAQVLGERGRGVESPRGGERREQRQQHAACRPAASWRRAGTTVAAASAAPVDAHIDAPSGRRGDSSSQQQQADRPRATSAARSACGGRSSGSRSRCRGSRRPAARCRERRHAQVAAGRRVGADDHDLAAELVRRALALRAVEVLVQVAEGDAREGLRPRRARRAPCRRRRAPDSRGPSRRAPAARAGASRRSRCAQVVAPADAVGVLGEVDQADAPELRAAAPAAGSPRCALPGRRPAARIRPSSGATSAALAGASSESRRTIGK